MVQYVDGKSTISYFVARARIGYIPDDAHGRKYPKLQILMMNPYLRHGFRIVRYFDLDQPEFLILMRAVLPETLPSRKMFKDGYRMKTAIVGKTIAVHIADKWHWGAVAMGQWPINKFKVEAKFGPEGMRFWPAEYSTLKEWPKKFSKEVAA